MRGTKGALLYFFIGGFFTIFLYQASNRLHLFEPQLLPFTAIDRMVPLIPWTIWIYFLEYLIFIVSWAWLRDDLERTKYFLAYMAILVISVIIFVFWPTTFPRDDFPLDGFPQTISVIAFQFLRDHMDAPTNCLPSLHVSSCYIAAWAFWKYDRTKFWIFFWWSTAVAVSTITTKQHYFADVWTAVLLTAVCYYFFYHCVSYEDEVGRAEKN